MSELAEEKDLVDAAIAGDTAAIEQLLRRHFPTLERHIASRIPARARRHLDVEDVLQVVCAQAFRDINKFQHRGEGAFFAWLRAIAEHRLIDALRKLERGDAHQISAGQIADASSLTDLLDLVCHDSDTPSKRARGQEAIIALRIAIAGLPPDQQEVIRLHCLEQIPVEEIAKQTGRTEAAVRGLVHRGKQKLAEAMGRSSRWLSKG